MRDQTKKNFIYWFFGIFIILGLIDYLVNLVQRVRFPFWRGFVVSIFLLILLFFPWLYKKVVDYLTNPRSELVLSKREKLIFKIVIFFSLILWIALQIYKKNSRI